MKHPQITPEKFAKMFWAKLLKASQPFRQEHRIFDKSEKKGRIYQPYEKRCWQQDNLLYQHILQWNAESMEILRLQENYDSHAPYDPCMVETIKEEYCIEGGDFLIPLMASSGFMLRHPERAEELLEEMKEVFSLVYPYFLSKAMRQELSEKGIPSWSGNIRKHLNGEM